MVACPEIIMTSGASGMARIFPSASNPSMCGSQISSRTRSILCFASVSKAASPLAALSVVYPSSSSTPLSVCRMLASSSTMSRLDMFNDGRWFGFRREGQFDDKSRACRVIFLHANRAVVVLDDSAHDSEAKAGSTLLRGKVRQKKLFLQL